MPSKIEKLTNLIQANRSQRSSNVVFGGAEYNRGGVCGPRTQEDFQLVYIQEGELEIHYKNERHQLQSGQIKLLIPGVRETLYFSRDQKAKHLWCSLHPSIVPLAIKRELKKNSRAVLISPTILTLFEVGFSRKRLPDPFAEGLIDTCGLAMLYEYLRLQESPPQNNETPVGICKVMDWISLNLEKKITLAKLASVSGVSISYLCRVFEKHRKQTPTQYLLSCRARRASELLRDTGFRIREIAEQTGFQNPYHFSRVFKKYFKMSPKKYRETLWKS